MRQPTQRAHAASETWVVDERDKNQLLVEARGFSARERRLVKHRVDLAELDAESAYLYLLIHTAQELYVSVAHQASKIARSVKFPLPVRDE